MVLNVELPPDDFYLFRQDNNRQINHYRSLSGIDINRSLNFFLLYLFLSLDIEIYIHR